MDRDQERAKWRDEFAKLGPKRVRDLLSFGGMNGRRRKHQAAVDWLRDQDAIAERRKKWITLAVAIFGAILGFVTLLWGLL
jgi:hypothetical protein